MLEIRIVVFILDVVLEGKAFDIAISKVIKMVILGTFILNYII